MGSTQSSAATPTRPSQSHLQPNRDQPIMSYFIPSTLPDLTHDHIRPSPADVAIALRMLECRKLPPELCYRILEEAQYWNVCRRLQKKGLTVNANSPLPLNIQSHPRVRGPAPIWETDQKVELTSELEVPGSDLKNEKGEIWYLVSAPIGCGTIRYPLAEGEPTCWVREVVVETMSRDQGWSDPNNRPHYGTYEHTYSWFELSLLRKGKTVPGSRINIQHNVHAGQYFKPHRLVFTLPHKLLSAARQGDHYVLWAMARYPGWQNHVQEASITVYSAPFPPP